MRCVAGGHKVDLRLVLPKTGGIRIYGSEEGYWRPDSLLPLKVTQTSGSCSIETADGRVVISQTPFSITFYDAAGNAVTQIGANNLAFRFGPDGKILAIDFRNRLSPDEVIYGFGEKYEHFNQNGSVLTLWGSDDWLGNGEGLANTTYKALPIFHSSRGYMVFDNSSYRLRADIGKTDPNQYRITQQGPIFDYYFLMGAPEKTLPLLYGSDGQGSAAAQVGFRAVDGQRWRGLGRGSLGNFTMRWRRRRKRHQALRGTGHSSFRDLCRRPFRPFAGIESIHGGARGQGFRLFLSRDSAR